MKQVIGRKAKASRTPVSTEHYSATSILGQMGKIMIPSLVITTSTMLLVCLLFLSGALGVAIAKTIAFSLGLRL